MSLTGAACKACLGHFSVSIQVLGTCVPNSEHAAADLL